jgi:signal transduction histidine kinase
MSCDEVSWITKERDALRRVAMLVVRGAPPALVFKAVATEMGNITGADYTYISRYQANNTMLVVASWGRQDDANRVAPIGSSWSLDPDSTGAIVARTGRPARMRYEHCLAGIGLWGRTHGCRSGVGSPIMVEGRLWGVLTILTKKLEPHAEDTEERMLEFIELVNAAIANAESRDELAASRARVVAARDANCKRIERDLHDGVQQHLVACELELRTLEADIPPGTEDLRQRMSEAVASLEGAIHEIREISRGLHPVIVSKGGIGSAIKVLARRSAIPVDVEVLATRRVADAVEVALYYVVSEALANAVKHARASRVHLELDIDSARAHVSVRDDGVGGADYGRGSGLIGLKDRIESLGGTIEVTSPLGSGTALVVQIPVDRAEAFEMGEHT